MPKITSISAVTLMTRDMVKAVHFYEILGFTVTYGGADQSFTSLAAGISALNLWRTDEPISSANWGDAKWGRIIFHVENVDKTYQIALDAGLEPEAPPANAPWGERYFHLADPDGHELSFACTL